MKMRGVFRKRDRGEQMPERFQALAIYNAEAQRGLLHDLEYNERMVRLQVEFDQWARGQRDE